MEGFKPTLALVKMVDSENPNLMNHTEHEIMVRNSSLLLFWGGAAKEHFATFEIAIKGWKK